MGRSSALRDLWAGGVGRAAALGLLGAALYANTLGNEFVWDDRLTAAGPGGLAALGQRTGAYYRPVVMLSFALDRALWGQWAPGFHATNVLCHLGVAWLVGALAGGVGLAPGVALASALVFAAHPVQTEAVAYVSGRTDPLAALFALLVLLAWRRARTSADRFALAAAVATVLTLLCKESALLVPLALLVPGAHPAARPPRPWLPLAASVLWLAVWSASGGPGLQGAGLIGRLPAIAAATLTHARLLALPLGLHLERFTPVTGWSLAEGLAAWALLAALGAALVVAARRVRGGLFLLALAALTYAPVSNVVPVYPAIAGRALFTAEHFLYLPLAGLAPLVVGALAACRPARVARARPVLLAAVLALWGTIVVGRNRDWRDEQTLFRHTLRFDPPAARVWFNLGNLELAAGRPAEAERLYVEAVARAPHDAPARLNLGIALQRQGRRAEAEAQYRAAVAGDACLTEARRALAGLLAARGTTDEAMRLLDDAGQCRR